MTAENQRSPNTNSDSVLVVAAKDAGVFMQGNRNTNKINAN